MKWQGKKKKRIAFTQDDVNNSITAKLKKFAEIQQPTSDRQYEAAFFPLSKKLTGHDKVT